MKRVLKIYTLVILIAIFSLQSCVTNYVIANPSFVNKDYNSYAKNSFDEAKSLEKNKAILKNSFSSEQGTEINSLTTNKRNSYSSKYNEVIDAVMEEAHTYLGTPYRYGGTTRRGIDCSAFVLTVFNEAIGLELPRIAAAQANMGEMVDKSELQKGDLLFFSQGKGRISHVGIVEEVNEKGEVKFIHAATSKGVMYSTLSDKYWGPKFRFAKRVVSEDMIDYSSENFANFN